MLEESTFFFPILTQTELPEADENLSSSSLTRGQIPF